MICHQGSARASQRLRQGSFQQPKVSPPPAKHTCFIQPSTPKAIPHRRVRVSSAGGGSPPGGHCCSLAFAASWFDHPGVGYSGDTEHPTCTPSTQPPAPTQGLRRSPRTHSVQTSADVAGLPEEPQHLPAQHEAPALFAKRFCSRATEACRNASGPVSSHSKTHQGWHI